MNGSVVKRMEHISAGKTTKSQRKLLEYFRMTDPKDVMYMSITQLAEVTGVAEATVLRFCRSLGFNGYQEFKLHLAQDASALREAGETVKPSVSVDYVDEILSGYHDALDCSLKSLMPERLEQAVEIILSARTVCCCGVGHSYLAAMELHNRLMKMGIPVYCEQDMHFQNILLSSRNERDALIVFSVSGSTKDVIEATELARSCGMKIIVVTCYENSPLTAYGDVVLFSKPLESPREAGAMVSKIMQLFMVDVICNRLRLCDRARFESYIAKSNVSTAGKLI